MRRNDNFILSQLNDRFYLIPIGQESADHKKSISLNNVGAYIWCVLQNETTKDQLIKSVIDEFQILPDQKIKVEKEVSFFVNSLLNKGLLTNYSNEINLSSKNTNISIADIKIKIYASDDILNANLSSFACEENAATDLFVNVVVGTLPQACPGKLLVRTQDVLILENQSFYYVIYLNSLRLREIHISKDLRNTTMFFLPPFDSTLKNDFFMGLKIPFLLQALSRKMIMLHSASIIYNDMIYCFSAKSGTGKTTHVSLWQSLIDVKVINGDLNLLLPFDESVFVYGTPWCGTSKIYSTEKKILGGIIFLSQSPVNKCTLLSPEDFFPKLLARIITPNWNTDLATQISNVAMHVIRGTTAFELECNISDESVYTVKKMIDENQRGKK